MPHATAVDAVQDDGDSRQDDEDEPDLNALQGDPGDGLGSFLDQVQNRELNPGEKADDAIDFGDLSDDDLAADDEEGQPTQVTPLGDSQMPEVPWEDNNTLLRGEYSPDLGIENGLNSEGMDDLFGDMPSSPVGDEVDANDKRLQNGINARARMFEHLGDEQLSESHEEQIGSATLPFEEFSTSARAKSLQPPTSGLTNAALSKEQQLQQALFEMSGSAPRRLEIPGPETHEQALKQLWPRFQRDTVPKFMDLLPPKKARYIGKPPLRTPKPVNPTKLSLEIAVDQEKSFRLASAPSQKPQGELGRQGLIAIQQSTVEEQRTDVVEDFDSDFERDSTAGVNWQDLQILCEDWDTQSSTSVSSVDGLEGTETVPELEPDDIWNNFAHNEDDLPGAPVAKVCSKA